MTPGTTTADDDDSEAEWYEAFGFVPEPSLVTGTAIDEFTPIYRALSRPTNTRGTFSPEQVDQWDITTVAVILGVDAATDVFAASFKSWQQEYDEWVQTEEAVRSVRES